MEKKKLAVYNIIFSFMYIISHKDGWSIHMLYFIYRVNQACSTSFDPLLQYFM